MYEKQNFYAGNPLTAAQLNAMEDGIVEAQSGGGNIEIGKGNVSTQQMPRTEKVNQYDADNELCFTFAGNSEAGVSGLVKYGAVGNNSASFCGRSSAQGPHSMAVNSQTVALGDESFAAGYATTTIGAGSFACGSKTVAKGTHSHTEGEKTIAESTNSHAEGEETRTMGRGAHAEGYASIAAGNYSHTEGNLTQGNGVSAHAEGSATVADTNASHTEGANNKVISYKTTADDVPGDSDGDYTDSPNYDDYASLEDYRVRAAACAHAEGNNTTVMGYSAHAEGVGTNAYGRASHAEGWQTQAGDVKEVTEGGQVYKISDPEKGAGAHASGYKTKAIANYSQAAGMETIANKEAQTVVGRYNNELSRDSSVFVVGGGNSATDRKNALEVITDGTIYIFWEGNYYSLNNMLNLIANSLGGGVSFFDAAKK